ncbi:MAG TPA: ABC transporter substrate-binding protein [Stellaceae bacterium]|nr:ABC transporter substrate-binding protein [Stellaceae bacterium]
MIGMRLALVALALLVSLKASAEEIKLATSRLLAYVAVPLMIDNGFLADEGLKVDLVTFDSAQPITVAVMSGDVDFGVGGLSGAFFNLAAGGKLRIIAAGTREMPGFNGFAYFVSNRAWAEGLRSLTDLPHHSVGVTQLGTTLEYSLGLAVEKYRLDFSTIRVMAMNSNTNLVAGLVGGQLDAGVVPSAILQPEMERGTVKRLAWVGDEVPGIQNNVAYASERVITQNPDLVARFLRAYRKAARLYHDAVADNDEKRRDGPHFKEVVASVAQFGHLTPEQALGVLPWIDRDARVDIADVKRQIAWYRSQGMIKGDVDLDAFLDRRFAEALPPQP